MPKLKVCGITSYEDACLAIDAGAEFLGFNFYPPSPRFIPLELAASIISELPVEIVSVGIFVNEETPALVLQKMAQSGVELAQLHGDESEEYCREIGSSRIIKALRIGKHFDSESVLGFPASALLVDAYDQKLYGGTGKIGNWEAARELASQTNVFLAGGLTLENIMVAIEEVHPYAVDVNSGVEQYPGKKDREKLQTLRTILQTVSES